MRPFVSAAALVVLLLVSAPRAHAQTTPFPYADGVEDTTAAKGVWTPAGTTGARFYTSTAGVNAHLGTKAWRVMRGGTITLRNPISLAGRRNPHVAVWTKAVWEGTGTGPCAGDCGGVALEVSLDGGSTWERVVPTTPMGPADGDYGGGQLSTSNATAKPVWKRMQWPIDAFLGSNVRLRLSYAADAPGGYSLALDDLLTDEAPARLVAGTSAITNRSFTVSWPASSATDFARYRVVVSTRPDYNGFLYHRELPSASPGDRFVFGVQNPYASSLKLWREQRRVRDVTVQGQTSVTFDTLGLAGTTYFARVYEVDTQGFTNQGSETVEQRTTLTYGPAVRAPFTETFDAGTTPSGWILEPTWAVTNEASAEPGHSAPGVLSDSPGTTYANYTDQYATVRVDLSGVKRPLLRFKHRYAMFNASAPGYANGGQSAGAVQWSRDGQRWDDVMTFAGTTEWKAEEFDLSQMGSASDGFLRFVMYSATGPLRDGWLIDDVGVSDNARVTIFPFRDDVESASPAWVLGTSSRVSVADAHSGTQVWQLNPGPRLTGDQSWGWLTLGGAIDLRSVQNPVLSLWARKGTHVNAVQVSSDGGRNWSHLVPDVNFSPNTWTRYSWSLDRYQSSKVLVRVGTNYGRPEIDDLEITGTSPGAMTSGTVEYQLDFRTANYPLPAIQPGDVVGVRGSDQSPLTTTTAVPLADPDGDRVYTARVPFTMPFGTKVNYDFVVIRGGEVVASDGCGRSFVYPGSVTVRAAWGYNGNGCPPFVRPGEAVSLLTVSGGGAPAAVQLTTGLHPQATAGLDTPLGESELPPAPPAGTFAARLVSGDGVNLGQGSLVDLRPGTADLQGSRTHYLLLQRATGAGDVRIDYRLPDRTRGTFRDAITGTLFDRSITGEGTLTIPATGPTANVTAFTLTLTHGETCIDGAVATGWNMVSAPLTAVSMSPTALYPGTTSHFGYDGGYQSASAMVPGKGYWLKADAASTPRLCGAPVAAYDIPLKAGWNMIGGFEGTATVAGLVATPSDVVASSFFGYNGGYTSATSLAPGRGYWVKAKSDGTLRATPGTVAHPAPDAASMAETASEEGASVTLTVEDAAGRRTTLRLVATPDGHAVLPPLPPSGLFDARFVEAGEGTSAGMASGTTLALQGAAYPVTLRADGLTDGQSVRIDDATGRTLATLHADAASAVLASGARFSVSGTALPSALALDAPAPSPARGLTTIRYALPEGADVRLRLYDVLGREVARLADGPTAAGTHRATLDASSLAPGVYVVRLDGAGRALTRTLVVVR